MIIAVRQVIEDRSWKGMVGRSGDHWIVWRRAKPKPYGADQHAVFGFDHITLHASTFEHRSWEWRDVKWIARVLISRWVRLPAFAVFRGALDQPSQPSEGDKQ